MIFITLPFYTYEWDYTLVYVADVKNKMPSLKSSNSSKNSLPKFTKEMFLRAGIIRSSNFKSHCSAEGIFEFSLMLITEGTRS